MARSRGRSMPRTSFAVIGSMSGTPHTTKWHSLHQRYGTYQIADVTVGPQSDEGFVQLAAVQPDKAAQPPTNDLYLHEAVARWAGWSSSAGRPGKHLSRYADPDKAISPDGDDADYRENEPVTPFKMKVDYQVTPGSLPALRFGRSYRFRARAVDLAGNSLSLNDAVTAQLSVAMALPQDSRRLHLFALRTRGRSSRRYP